MIIAVIAVIIAIAALAAPYVLAPRTGSRTSPSSQMREFYVVTPELSFIETVNGIPHYVFTPTQVTVNQGDTVLIHFYNTADDTHHTFTLPSYGINMDLAPGQHKDIQFTAAQTGTFAFSCTFHPTTMRGELTVLPA
jgi:plastocyanin